MPKRSGILKEMEEYAAINSVPISQPETMKLLEVLVHIADIKNVLEVGCAIGYSSICMASAGCKSIDTIEISDEMAEIAAENIKKAGYGETIHIYKGDAREILPTLDKEYDMIFVDAAKGQYNEFFGHCMRMLKHGGVLVSDNVLYKGMTATDELVQHRKITIIRRLRTYLDMLSSSDSLETSVLPVGDGVAISFKY